jgi:acyl-coenzyme A synthetase/AMP-(fatty) acid ligase/3-hydroxymyristoyl/3-hydroxydecanoyl-(acyl carrier protein) dehydratase
VLALEAAFEARLPPGTRIFATVSHQHIYGLLFRVLWPLSAGRPFHENLLLHPQELYPRMLECQHAVLVTTPVHLRRMAAAEGLAQVAPICRALFSSGGPLEAETAASVFRQLGAAPLEILGSTETGGVAVRERPRSGELFRPLPGVRIGLEPGDDGLVAVSPFVSVGLVTHTGERRFRMGDCARLEPDGSFQLLGRSDRTAKIGEKRLSLPEMEKDLAQHPAVAEAALLVLPRASEQRVHAAVVLSETGREILVREGRRALGRLLSTHLSVRWDAVLLPRVWRYADALPRNPQGKLPLACLAALFEPRNREPVLQHEERGEGWLERRLAVPGDLAYLDGHFDGRPVVPAIAQLRWVMDAAFDLLGCTPRVSRFEVLKFPELLLPGQSFALRVERRGGDRLDFRLYQGDRVFASGRGQLAAASGESP